MSTEERRWSVYQTLVTGNETTGRGMFRLGLAAPEIAKTAQPGQFVTVRAATGTDPLLRRPLSIHSVNEQRGTISLLIAAVGRVTTALSRMVAGEELSVAGPLGNGFGLVKPGTRLLLIGGGIGGAPLLFAAERWHRLVPTIAVLGAQTAACLPVPDSFRQLGIDVIVTTDDGTAGRHGQVLEPAKKIATEPSEWTVFACGPEPMLKAVDDWAVKTGVFCRLSVETRFACGVGACAGCALPLRDGTGYLRTCHDGPVVDAGKVLFGDES